MIKIAGLLTAMFVLAHALTPEERNIILNFHKDTRYAVDPPASNMMLMKYAKKLETLAESWVKRCLYQHPNPQQYPEFKGYGQNLAVSGGAAQDIKWLSRGWADEKKYYFYHNNSCASGKTCGHYTQMVWATSEKLGCAINRCDNIFPQWPKPIYLLACQYKPPGNFFRKKPYEEGASCTKCPKFSTCKDKQCSSKLI